MKKLIGSLFIFLTICTASIAQSDRTVNERQAAQRGRIAQGNASGDLTRKESARLRHEQRHIRRSERRAKADGNVTVKEKNRIDRQQNRASRHIRRSKHNGAVRPN